MKKIRVLVTGAGGCTVGEGIIKALRTKPDYEIYASDVDPISPHLFRAKQGFLVPKASDPDYLSFIIDLCQKQSIDILIPGSDFENRELARVRQIVKNPIILTNAPKVVAIGSDGWQTFCFLHDNNFKCPDSCLYSDLARFQRSHDFPLIIKPRFSQGSHGVYKVENQSDLDHALGIHRRDGVESLIQQYMGTNEEEYTVGVLSSRTKKVISVVTLKRTLIAGASFKMSVVTDTALVKLAKKLSHEIGSDGPLNFQARKERGKYYIFEINPRFSGTTPVRCGLGINEPDLLIKNYLFKTSFAYRSPRKDLAICRVFQECYIPVAKLKQLRKRGVVTGGAEFLDYL